MLKNGPDIGRIGSAPIDYVVLTTVFIAFFMLSCGGSNQAASNNVHINLVSVPADSTFGGASSDPEALVIAARLSVSGLGMDAVTSDIVDFALDAFQIPDYPLGLQRQFGVEYLGRADPWGSDKHPVIARGRSVPIDITSGNDRIRSQVFVSPVNSFVPVAAMDVETGLAIGSSQINTDRVGASMTELDDGRILICGGARVRLTADTWYMPDDLYTLTSSCETYDPETGLFSELPEGMSVKRAYHQAIKLGSPNNPDGRVVLIGGYTVPAGGAITVTNLVDIYDPWTGQFISATSNEGDPGLYGGAGRALFTADLVNPDKNLIVLFGGYSNMKAAGGTYDIVWVTEGSVMTVNHGLLYSKDDPEHGTIRYNHALAKVGKYADELTDGKGYQAYLLVGGENESGVIDTVEPYVITCTDVDTCKLQRQDQLVMQIPGGGRSLPVVAYDPLHNFLFIAGGFNALGGKNPTDRVDIFRVNESTFRDKEFLGLGIALGGMSVAEMDDGRFLLAGGSDGANFFDTVRIISPKGPVLVNGEEIETPAVKSDVPIMNAAGIGFRMLTDQTGRVLIVGGIDNQKDSITSIMYNPR